MKIFRKFLVSVMSFGIFFISAFLMHSFAVAPNNLEECCLELDNILTQEEKNAIKTSLVNDPNSYLCRASIGELGNIIIQQWLYLHTDGDGADGLVRSPLAELLLSHGVGFDGSMELDHIMSSVILDCYRHYLNGEQITRIEDLVVDYWVNRRRCFDPTFPREQIAYRMDRWIQSIANRQENCGKNISEDYLREKFDIYNEDGCMRGYTLGLSGSIVPVIEMLDPANKAYKELSSSNDFKMLVNNTKPANTLIDSEISKSKLYDDAKYGNMGMPYTLEETELENINSGKTLLRVNEKNHKMIYTVSKSGDWYIFKNFSPTKGSFGHERNAVKLLLRSIWCAKMLPDIARFDTIIPDVTKMSDVINIDPSFRYFEENGIRYSTHTFADKDGSRISIEYKKDVRGVYKVSNIAKVKEGWNLLPYLLPIDRKLIDPNYDESSAESEETTMVSDSSSDNESSSCEII